MFVFFVGLWSATTAVDAMRRLRSEPLSERNRDLSPTTTSSFQPNVLYIGCVSSAPPGAPRLQEKHHVPHTACHASRPRLGARGFCRRHHQTNNEWQKPRHVRKQHRRYLH